ncbi:hypothetical protein BHE74_00034351 [Ensete ventricosum]|nr:hypothetical protein BHE74_00034351 [Ensete ventricosum]RZS11303.1 hypothetical protein BHM03_00042619 [Ensete ventricosum]
MGSHTYMVSRKNAMVINFREVASRVKFRSVFRAPSRKFKILANPNVIAHGKSYKHDFAKKLDAGPLLQATAGGLQVQTHSPTAGAAYEERDSEQDEREVGYSPRGEEAPSGVPTEKKGHRERLTMAETHLDVLEASVEELYHGQGRLLGVETSQEEAETRIENVESLIDQLTEDTKDSV